MRTKVIKFGGTIFKESDGFANLLKIINSSNDRLILVISALGSTTRDLKDCGITAMNKSFENAVEKLEKIIDFHSNILNTNSNNNNLEYQLFLKNIKDKILKVIEGINLIKEISPKILDKLLAFGELLAINTISYLLKINNFDFHSTGDEPLIITDNNFGNAKPDLELTTQKIRNAIIPIIASKSIILTKGFVALTNSGEQTTMGIESSNLTAILICYALEIKNLMIITDVDGIRTADPKLVSNSKLIGHLSYKDAFNYAISGLKLIYPEMIQIAEHNNISIEFTSVKNHSITKIGNFSDNNDFPLIINFSKLIETEIDNNIESLNQIYSKFYKDIIFSIDNYTKKILFINIDFNTNKKFISDNIISEEKSIIIIENLNEINHKKLLDFIYLNSNILGYNYFLKNNKSILIVNSKENHHTVNFIHELFFS